MLDIKFVRETPDAVVGIGAFARWLKLGLAARHNGIRGVKGVYVRFAFWCTRLPSHVITFPNA